MKFFLVATLFALSLFSAGQTCTTGVAPKFTSATSASFTELSAANFAVAADGQPAPTITEATTDVLPAGVTFNGHQLIGTPSDGTAGNYTLHFTATNGTSPDVVQTVAVTVLNNQTTGGLWQPTSAAPISWQWEISNTPSASQLLAVQVYDIDGEAATTALVAALHSNNIKAICYVDVGTAENFRSDFSQFTAAEQGKTNGWPGEKWLDIRVAALKPIMTARFANCKNKGFDAVEPDNIDGYTNSTGFPLTAADQLAYNTWIANTVHSFGLSVALKNDGDQAKGLEPLFDFGIVEECARYNECNLFFPFRDANKAVFAAEYQANKQAAYCKVLNADNFNGAFFDLDLTGKRTPCR